MVGGSFQLSCTAALNEDGGYVNIMDVVSYM